MSSSTGPLRTGSVGRGALAGMFTRGMGLPSATDCHCGSLAASMSPWQTEASARLSSTAAHLPIAAVGGRLVSERVKLAKATHNRGFPGSFVGWMARSHKASTESTRQARTAMIAEIAGG